MAMDREERRQEESPMRAADAKEERGLFPFWTLLVLALCAGIWIYGAKLYEDRMAAYESYAAISRVVNTNTFFPGVSVDGVELGGMTMEEAQQLFVQREGDTSETFSLVVASGERRWRITSNEIPISFDTASVLRRAWAMGRSGTLEERSQEIARIADEGVRLSTGYTYDRSAVRRLVDIIGDSLDYAAKDATLDAFDVGRRTFTFTEAKDGYQIDREKLQSDILEALDAEQYDKVIAPKGNTIKASVQKSDLVGHFGRVSVYSTTTTNDKDRNTNIALSADALNGRVVMPGETLSFNSCTGQRTTEKGYREAHAIAGGMLIDDTGGGVCQTSSTLFNAVIRADLEIVKRSAHTWPSTYVNKGEDATVNWPSLDFVFRNNGKYPVFVVAWYEKQTVTVEIYGKKLDDGKTIELESETIETIKPSNEVLYTRDETLPAGTRKAGQKKRTGYVVDTYKVVKDASGNVISRSKLWRTTYRAMQDEIRYN